MFEKIAIILLLNIVFYAKALTYKYSSDDVAVFLRKTTWKNEWHRRFLQVEGTIRTTPQEDHFITIILHAITSSLVYVAFGADDVSFLAAILFSINPITNQGSVWISGRGYVLATMGMLLAISFPYIALPALFIATYANAGFFMPLVLLGTATPWLFAFAPICWAVYYKRFKGNVKHKMQMEMIAEDKKLKPEKIVLATKTFGWYFLNTIIPFKLSFYHSFLQGISWSGRSKGYSIFDRFFWVGVIVLCGIIYYWLNFTWSMFSFGLLWWCIGIAPFCNVIRMSQEIAERYAYLPSVGAMYCLSCAILNIERIFPWLNF
jgi:hypothetical protein